MKHRLQPGTIEQLPLQQLSSPGRLLLLDLKGKHYMLDSQDRRVLVLSHLEVELGFVGRLLGART